MSELDTKLRAYKTSPRSKDEALESMKQLKREIGLLDVKSNKDEAKEILKKAGSLSAEILELKKTE